MAHTLDTKAQTSNNTSPVTLGYTCGASASVLVVGIGRRASSGVPPARSGGAPTYNGVALSLGVEQVGDSNVACEIWYLLNPTLSSAYNIVVPNTGGIALRVIASSYNVPSGYVSALDVANSAFGNSANPSCSVTTTVNGDAVVDMVMDEDNNIESGRTQTLLFATDEGTYSSAASYALQATLGAITFGHTMAADHWAQVMVSFKQSAISATGNNRVLMII